jgi:hypothetical protein
MDRLELEATTRELRSILDKQPQDISQMSLDRANKLLSSISAQLPPDWASEIDLAKDAINKMAGGPNQRVKNWQRAFDAVYGLDMRASIFKSAQS